MKRRLLGFVLLAAAGLSAVGCIPLYLWYYSHPFELFCVLAGYEGYYKTATRIEQTFELDVEVQVGGIGDPTYTVTLHDGDGGDYGTFQGTGVVKRGRFVTIKDEGSEGLKETVAAMLSDALGGADVTITEATATVKASEAPGGVDAVFKAKVKYKGTIDSGQYSGATIKGGKITGQGSEPTFGD